MKNYSKVFTHQSIWFLVKAIGPGLEMPSEATQICHAAQSETTACGQTDEMREWMRWQKALGVTDFLPWKEDLKSEMQASCSLSLKSLNISTHFTFCPGQEKANCMDFTYSCLLNSDFSLQSAFKNQTHKLGECKSIPERWVHSCCKTNQVSKPELLSMPSCEFPWETQYILSAWTWSVHHFLLEDNYIFLMCYRLMTSKFVCGGQNSH